MLISCRTAPAVADGAAHLVGVGAGDDHGPRPVRARVQAALRSASSSSPARASAAGSVGRADASSGPSATRRPRATTTTRSQVAATSSSTWLESSTVPPFAACALQLRRAAHAGRAGRARWPARRAAGRRARPAAPRRAPVDGACRTSTRRSSGRRPPPVPRSRAPRPGPPGRRGGREREFVARGPAGMEAVAVQHSVHAAGRLAPAPRSRARGRTGSAASSSSRRRSGRGSRTRCPPAPRTRARRPRSSARSAWSGPRR